MEPEDLRDQVALCISQRKNLEAIFNSVTDGILVVDAQFRVANLNLAAQEITGLSRERAVGKLYAGVFPKADGSNTCHLDRAVEGGEMLQDYEMDIQRPDGAIRTIQLTTHVLQDEKEIAQGVVAIFRDMTELQQLRTALQNRGKFERLVGKNHRMREIYQLIEDIGDSDATVLITGASGTGKELVAEAIHRNSHRRDGPFVKVNCSALSEGLLESELFGHVKGAFTGAIRDKPGRFELAQGGTIFLDEIGDISPSVQVKLLRILQDREFERVGGTEIRKVDIRIIAATHRDLKRRIAEGFFREDLYYRLYVMPIELPALRERKEDLPLLVSHFVEKFKQQTGRPILEVDAEAIALFMDYDWPGNVRELENAIEHAFVKCHGNAIEIRDLPLGLVREVRGDLDPQSGMSEKERIRAVLEQTGWNRSRAARMLGIHRSTIWRKMKEYDIEVPEF